MKLHVLINLLRNFLSQLVLPIRYFYKLRIFFSHLKNLNLFSFIVKNKLNNLDIKTIKKRKIKKNILFIIHSLERGGAERQLVKLSNLLYKKNFDVKILITDFKSKLNIKNSYILDLNKRIKVEYIIKSKKINKFLKETNFKEINNISFVDNDEKYKIIKTFKFIKKHKPDIVHSFLDDSNIVAGISCILAGTPKIVLSLRSVAPYRFTFYKSYWKECYRFFSKIKNISIVCNSSNNAKDYEIWLKIKKGIIQTTDNIYDFKKIRLDKKKKFKKNNKIIFGCIARLNPEKNLFYLIKIFKKINIKNIRLKIVGDGYLKQRLINFSKKNIHGNKIKFVGIKTNIDEFLKSINLFILTSKHEGTPNVLLEAQNYCLPIFTTNVGGINETVINGYNSYFIPKNNSSLAAKIIENKIKNKNFLKRRNLFFIKKKLSKFSSKEVYKNIYKIYNS